jgi:hypothetical protein
MNIQHTLRLQLKDQNGGEALGDTCDPKQRVGADGFLILQRSAAGGNIERGNRSGLRRGPPARPGSGHRLG